MSKQNVVGRPRIVVPKDFEQRYELWRAGAISAVTAYTLLGLSKSTFYRIVQAYEAEKLREQQKLESEHEPRNSKDALKHLRERLKRKRSQGAK